MNALLLIHAAATWMLVGLIWTVQIVLYPLFSRVPRRRFQAYHAQHLWRISFTIGPLVCMECATLAMALMMEPRQPWLLASLAPLAFAYTSTFLVQVPLHYRLALGFDARTLRRLIVSNRWRAVCWTTRGVCVLTALG